MTHLWPLLGDAGMLLAACLILGALFARFKQSPLIGYILAGVFIAGPGSLRLIKTQAEIESLSELGIALLLFTLGLEFSWQRIRRFGFKALAGGIFQVLVTPVLFSVLLLIFGMNWPTAGILALAVTLSSTAAVLRLLYDRSETDSIHGRNSVAILLIQDLAVVPFALLISFLSQQGSSEAFVKEILVLCLSIAGLIVGLFLVMRLLSGKVFGYLLLERNREMATILAVVSGLGSAWISHHFGLSPALGAFIAGMLLGASPYASQIRVDVQPFKIVFLTLFFGSAGMIADPIWISQNLLMVFELAIAVIVGKTIIAALGFVFLRHTIGNSIAIAMYTSQIGEFAFVLGRLAFNGGVLTEEVFQLLTSVTIITLLVTPYTIAIAKRTGRWVDGFLTKQKNVLETQNASMTDDSKKCVVLGFGPSGKAVAEAAHKNGFRTTVIELNEKAAQLARELGMESHIGDIEQTAVLEEGGVSTADVVVITVPDSRTVSTVIRNVKILAPLATIIARSRHQIHVEELIQAGATHVISDESAVGSRLAEKVFSEIS